MADPIRSGRDMLKDTVRDAKRDLEEKREAYLEGKHEGFREGVRDGFQEGKREGYVETRRDPYTNVNRDTVSTRRPETLEVHTRKKSVAVPALIAGGLAGLLGLAFLTRRGPDVVEEVSVAEVTTPAPQPYVPEGETQGTFTPKQEEPTVSAEPTPAPVASAPVTTTEPEKAAASGTTNEQGSASTVGKTAPQSAQAAGGQSAAMTTTQAETGKGAARPDSYAHSTVPQATCGSAPPTVFFSTGSSDLTDDDKLALDRLASCLNESDLDGNTLKLIGQTDQKGESEYNLELGAERAQTVASYLRDKGVSADRLEIVSWGDLNSMADDKSGMAAERRVDIRFAP